MDVINEERREEFSSWALYDRFMEEDSLLYMNSLYCGYMRIVIIISSVHTMKMDLLGSKKVFPLRSFVYFHQFCVKLRYSNHDWRSLNRAGCRSRVYAGTEI